MPVNLRVVSRTNVVRGVIYLSQVNRTPGKCPPARISSASQPHVDLAIIDICPYSYIAMPAVCSYRIFHNNLPNDLVRPATACSLRIPPVTRACIFVHDYPAKQPAYNLANEPYPVRDLGVATQICSSYLLPAAAIRERSKSYQELYCPFTSINASTSFHAGVRAVHSFKLVSPLYACTSPAALGCCTSRLYRRKVARTYLQVLCMPATQLSGMHVKCADQ